MELVGLVTYCLMLAAFLGGLVGTIASLFYTVPAALRGKRGLEALEGWPRWIKNLLWASIGAFVLAMAMAEVLIMIGKFTGK